MRAIVQERFGPPQSLRLVDVERPVPGEGTVLLRVRSAALNPADWHVLRGSPVVARPALGWTRPRRLVAGTDAAGVVEQVGPGVVEFEVGEEVYGFVPGSFAEYVVAPVARLAPKPPTLGFTEAAALPVAGTTALRAVRDVAGVRSGQRVLVTGAGGGVGHIAVQVAVGLGAEVTGVCSAASAGLVRELGAQRVIDYRTTDPTGGPERYDVILDNAGGRPARALRRVLTPTGILVMNDGGHPGGLLGPLWPMLCGRALGAVVAQRIVMMPAGMHREELHDLNRWVAAGKLRPVVGRTWPLERAAQALAEVERGHSRGKSVLEIG